MRNESCSEMPLLKCCFHLIKSVNGKFDVGWSFGETVPVTSSFSTSSLCLSTSRPSKICSLVLARSLRAVAMTGRSVVLSRRLASWRPMPRDAGDTRSQGFDMADHKMTTSPHCSKRGRYLVTEVRPASGAWIAKSGLNYSVHYLALVPHRFY